MSASGSLSCAGPTGPAAASDAIDRLGWSGCSTQGGARRPRGSNCRRGCARGSRRGSQPIPPARQPRLWHSAALPPAAVAAAPRRPHTAVRCRLYPPAESAKGAAPDPSPLLAAAHDAGAAPSQQAMSAPAVEVTTAAPAPAPASDGAAAAAADAEKASAEVAQAVAKAASKHSSPTSSSSSDSSKAKAAAAAPAAAAAEEEVQQVRLLGGRGCLVW